MPTVRYEAAEGIFLFEEEEVIHALKDLDSPDSMALIKFLESQTGETKEISQEKDFFSYAVLKLLDQGKGSVRCQICGEDYQSRKLRSFSLGAGESPFNVKTRWKRSLLPGQDAITWKSTPKRVEYGTFHLQIPFARPLK